MLRYHVREVGGACVGVLVCLGAVLVTARLSPRSGRSPVLPGTACVSGSMAMHSRMHLYTPAVCIRVHVQLVLEVRECQTLPLRRSIQTSRRLLQLNDATTHESPTIRRYQLVRSDRELPVLPSWSDPCDFRRALN